MNSASTRRRARRTTRARRGFTLIETIVAMTLFGTTALSMASLAAVVAKRAEAMIPSNPSRTRRLPLDAHLYKARHLIECCFSKLKQFRRVATRYEKTARNDRAVVTIAATVLWLR